MARQTTDLHRLKEIGKEGFAVIDEFYGRAERRKVIDDDVWCFKQKGEGLIEVINNHKKARLSWLSQRETARFPYEKKLTFEAAQRYNEKVYLDYRNIRTN